MSKNLINGVDAAALGEIISDFKTDPDTGEDRHVVNFPNLAAMVQAVTETPLVAKCKFYTSAEWLGGAKIKSAHPGFDQAEVELLIHHREESPKAYVGDEPAALLGSDAGPSASNCDCEAMVNHRASQRRHRHARIQAASAERLRSGPVVDLGQWQLAHHLTMRCSVPDQYEGTIQGGP